MIAEPGRHCRHSQSVIKMNNKDKILQEIFKNSSLLKKKQKSKTRYYLWIKIKSNKDKRKLEPLAQILQKHGFQPKIRKKDTYYQLLLTHMKDVKRAIEQYISIENLKPEHREIYDNYYREPNLWGLRYNLNPALKDPEKAKIIYYILGAIAGDGYRYSEHRLAIAVVDSLLAEKLARKARKIGLHPTEYPEKQPERTVYHVIIGSTHLIRLHQNVQANPQQLEQLPEKHFWAYLEGLYETDGSLRLIDNHFEVRIRLRKPPGPKILEHLEKRLLKMGLSATRNPYKKGYAYVLRIKEMKSVVKLFTNIDPIIKNPKTGTLSTKIIKHAKKRGINPQTISQQWRKRWKEYLEKYPDA